jgi:hypothetical protein
MRQALSESAIVREVAAQVCQRTARKVIRSLQQLKDALLSGDDSCLTSAWEELCVQVQYEHSFDWETYEATVKQFLAAEVGQLAPHERDAIWLQTPAGDSWDIEDEGSRKPYPVLDEEVVDYLMSEYIYPEASDWSNQRIRKYLEQSLRRD